MKLDRDELVHIPKWTIFDPVPDLYFAFPDDERKLKDLYRINLKHTEKMLELRLEYTRELAKLTE